MNWRERHAEHLASNYWRVVKKSVWRRDRGCCTRCGTPPGNGTWLDVHHRSYTHFGRELEHLDDVTLLCRPCHSWQHGKYDYDPLVFLGSDFDEMAKIVNRTI